MHNINVPKEIYYNDILDSFSLSPNNYRKLSIENKNVKKISSFLMHEAPFTKGIEPGSAFYVKKSHQIFLRNSCINNIQTSVDVEKYIYLNPNYYNENMLINEDVLLCTDANIGDCCLYISDNRQAIISSGIVKLNFKSEQDKYYVLAFLHDDYFRMQLEAKTPKGSTIRHSGELFMDCEIPFPNNNQSWVYKAFESLVKNIAYAEFICNEKMRKTESIIHQELMTTDYDYVNPTYSLACNVLRLDSGIYSNRVFNWKQNVLNYSKGYSDLGEYGFKLKRGPNLAKRDLGRSLQSETYVKGYNILIYPSDISSAGYIEKVSYLGARNPIWFLTEKDILFSAEGTIGKTFIICDTSMRFTTNFHGTIISPINKNQNLNKSVFLGLYLNYLRSQGIFSKMSVGGNGGSFAVGYWDNILIPKFDDRTISQLLEIYCRNGQVNPMIYEQNVLRNIGIYQINKFLIRCKEILKALCDDIKMNRLQEESFYTQQYDI